MALLKVLLVLLGLGVSVNSDVSLHKRIIGGYDCDVKERLYHVRLEGSNGTDTILCGGSLIHSEWILAAAHCWTSEPGWTTTATLGVHPRTAKQEKQIIQHNPVVYVDQVQQHDIMLLRLQRPFCCLCFSTPESGNQATSRTRTCLAQVCWTRDTCRGRRTPSLRTSDGHSVGATVQLAGEGLTTTGPNNRRLPGGPISPHLQCVNMKVLGVYFMPTSGHVLLAEAPNKDSCRGDSGGGVIFNDMIYGVTVDSGKDYACQTPTVFMDVCEYMEWIRQKIGLK